MNNGLPESVEFLHRIIFRMRFHSLKCLYNSCILILNVLLECALIYSAVGNTGKERLKGHLNNVITLLCDCLLLVLTCQCLPRQYVMLLQECGQYIHDYVIKYFHIFPHIRIMSLES